MIVGIMAFGSGVLISALAFDLMDEAYKRGGFDSAAVGFIGGAAVYTAANWFLARQGAKHRKRSGQQQPSDSGSGMAIAVGALLDGIPESIVIGLSMLKGGAVSTVAVIAIFISNIPEGLSSAAGMKKAGRSALYIFGVWGGIAAISGLGALLGYALFGNFSDDVIAATTATAAGAILAMLADTMIPEAFEEAHDFAGLLWIDPVVSLLVAAVIGFGTWGLLRDSVALAVDAVPKEINPDEVHAYLAQLPGVHHLHIWPMSTTETALTAHLVKPDAEIDDELLCQIERELHDRFEIGHATIQLERDGQRCC